MIKERTFPICSKDLFLVSLVFVYSFWWTENRSSNSFSSANTKFINEIVKFGVKLEFHGCIEASIGVDELWDLI